MKSIREVIKEYAIIGEQKAARSRINTFLLGAFAGMFIAFAAVAANTVSCTIESQSLAKFLGACVFPSGLAMIMILGGELFTGNCLMVISVLDKKITIKQLLVSWGIVYLGNFFGSFFIAALVVLSNQLNLFGGELLNFTITIAIGKVSMGFIESFCKGILCNILVCFAVLMGLTTEKTYGKVITVFFPVMWFVLCGFEHSVANMYYIPVALLAKNILVKNIAGVSNLTWWNFLIKNLLPVTLGNIVGGAGFVAVLQYLVYNKKLILKSVITSCGNWLKRMKEK